MDTIRSVRTYIAEISRDTPYLGPLADGETINRRGYIVRKGNKTIYPTVDRSVIVRIETNDGVIGWGETYGICAPKAVCAIINDLLAPVVEGRDPVDVECIWDDLYDLMRVRGFFGGFYVDAIAAIDIALWDIVGKLKGKSISELMSDEPSPTIPGYVSGLPAATLIERIDLAQDWVSRGFRAVKFAGVVSHEGIIEEFGALRSALGYDADIMVDMHWKFQPDEAINVIKQLEAFTPRFVEAPVKPEDVEGLARVATSVSVPIAGGEEWRTTYEASPRIHAKAISIIQPEMGHTGITQFMRISKLAEKHGIAVAPHATIGVGIFMAASLHASSCLPNLLMHEYQHSIFDKNLKYIDGELTCESGEFSTPSAIGLGAEPSKLLLETMEYLE